MAYILLIVIYLAFISLGLPDALLGAAWPTMYEGFGVPVSFAGGISMLVAVGTVTSSLLSDRLTRRFGAGIVTAASVLLTSLLLFVYSGATEYWHMIVWAIPFGLGAGSVDAALNNYVALHYTSRDMSWLHAMWGIGAIIGPYVLGNALKNGLTWNAGYRAIGWAQLAIMVVIVCSLPLWKKRNTSLEAGNAESDKVLSLAEIFRIPGAKQLMISFFCYCALEQTAMLWGSSYLVLHKGIAEDVAAKFASLFLIGLTGGRILGGFLANKFTDDQMIRAGFVVVAVGIAAMLLPLGDIVGLVGLVLIGLGCAPIYPCIIHSTPANFGADKSQAIIGVQMASAYVGIIAMPPLFGLIANNISVALYPVYMLAILGVMVWMYEWLLKKVRK
ncbi:MAG: MFS transporter [Clostridiales bacterium]|nr:MFS transporter [Clostridiales bacterium]